MLNSISELYHLRLENISPTLTLDYMSAKSYEFFSSLGSPLLKVLLFFSKASKPNLWLLSSFYIPHPQHISQPNIRIF